MNSKNLLKGILGSALMAPVVFAADASDATSHLKGFSIGAGYGFDISHVSEKKQAEKSAEEAHVTIAKNLEKIQQLEAKNDHLENEKCFEKVSEKNTKLEEVN